MTTTPTSIPATKNSTLTALRPPLDVSNCTSWKKLQEELIEQALGAFLDFVASTDPTNLAQSMRLRLEADGAVNAEALAAPMWKAPRVAAKAALVIDTFRAASDARPTALWHRWVPDENGPYIGIPRHYPAQREVFWAHVTAPLPEDLCFGRQELWAELGVIRFRLEPYTAAEVVALITSRDYRLELAERVDAWLLAGRRAALMAHLSFASTKLAVHAKGVVFVDAMGGWRTFLRRLDRGLQEEAQRRADEGPELSTVATA